MQYYTKQELQGAGRYTGKCRIGNWNEDMELDEVRLKDYIAKKEQGTLKMDKFQKRMNVALNKVELSKIVADDEYVHFGDVFQLQNLPSASVLAVDVESKDPRSGENACAVTSSFITESCARNTFMLKKFNPPKTAYLNPTYDDEVLHYGQKVKLMANPMCVGAELSSAPETPLFLKSYAISTTHFSKFSRFQEVVLSPNDSYDAVWQVLTPDPAKRLVSEGVPVMAGAPILLQHCATAQNLSVEGHSVMNDFGKELEVCSHNTVTMGNVTCMEGMQSGKPVTMMTKAPKDGNLWVFVGGEKVATC